MAYSVARSFLDICLETFAKTCLLSKLRKAVQAFFTVFNRAIFYFSEMPPSSSASNSSSSTAYQTLIGRKWSLSETKRSVLNIKLLKCGECII